MLGEFGSEQDFYDFLYNAVSPSRVNRRLSSVEAQQWMIHRYETDYGIFNHDTADPSKHYSLVKFHDAEDIGFGDLLYERLEQFVEAGVFKHTGLDFDAFMNKPRHMVLKILEVSRRIQNQVSKIDLDALAGKK